MDASGLWPGKAVTEIERVGDFWEAEPEHQDRLERYPTGYTCHYPRSGWVLPRGTVAKADQPTSSTRRDCEQRTFHPALSMRSVLST